MAFRHRKNEQTATKANPRTTGASQTRALFGQHKLDLDNSGLTAETVTKAGIYSGTADEVRRILGFEAGTGLVFPYPNCAPFARVKLDDKGSDGKRYRSPRGSTNHLYIPPILDASILRDAHQSLHITEGEKKALKGCQEGIWTIGLAGVWAWRSNPTGTESHPLPDLDRITWAGRNVFLVFDSDIQTNEDVQRAEEALAQELARRRATVYAIRLPGGSQRHSKVGLDDYLVNHSVSDFRRLDQEKLADRPTPLGISFIDFLSKEFPPADVLVEGLLASDGGGWIGGEEKLGKTFYALEEALCLALKLPVCGRFQVPTQTRVLFIEEEDPPQRVQRRIQQLLRGHEQDPEDFEVQIQLTKYFQLAVWEGFSLDKPEMVTRLEASLMEFQPRVVYLDVLRKLTHKDLNKADEASKLLETLDQLRRKYDVIFRVVHHFRKGQGGYRTGRGSQEISGSYVLGAWGENSLFFLPISKTQGTARVEIQRKDAAGLPPFKLTLESSGEQDTGDETVMRLVAHDLDQKAHEAELKEQVYDAIQACPKTQALKGRDGVTLKAICQHLKRLSGKPVRKALEDLVQDKRIEHVGTAPHNADLWDVLERVASGSLV